MSRRSNLAQRASVFAALGDETRLSLVDKLRVGESQTISQLTKGTHLTRQAITKHLRVLEDVGLVKSRPSGRENFFIFDPDPIEGLQEYLDLVAKQWDQALHRLKNFVED